MALSNGLGAISRPLNSAAQAASKAVDAAKSNKAGQIKKISLKFKVKMGGSKKGTTETESD